MDDATLSTRPYTLNLEEFMPYRLAVVAKAVSQSFSKTYASRFGITVPQWRVMAAVGRDPGCSATSIVEHAAMDKVQVSRAVRGLVEMGLLERRADDSDRRNSKLGFTPKGREIYDRIVPVGLDFEDKLMSALEPGEAFQLNRLLDKLMARADAL